MAFVFYDTETTGSETFFDQILQFAAFRTDSDLNEIGRFEIRCRIQPHILPSPGALIVTGMTLDRVLDTNLPTLFQMASAIHQKLTEWSPAVFVGYNSLEFDEDLVRQTFYQSLLPTYLTNTNGNSRLDVMRLALAANEFAPGSLAIPLRPDGKNTFRLDRLAPENGFQHPNAHDAMADVEATLFMARLARDRIPWVWDHMVTMGKKPLAMKRAQDEPVCLYTEFSFNKPHRWLVSAIAADPGNSGNVIAFNLEHDPSELLTIGEESLKKWAKSKPKPLREIKASNCPILLDLSFAQGRVDILKIGEQEILRRGSPLQSSPELRHRLLRVCVEARETYEESHWLERQIYCGFASRSDETLMREYQKASWARRMEISEQLEDERFRRTAKRIIFNERPETLDGETRDAFSRAVAKRWLSNERCLG